MALASIQALAAAAMAVTLAAQGAVRERWEETLAVQLRDELDCRVAALLDVDERRVRGVWQMTAKAECDDGRSFLVVGPDRLARFRVEPWLAPDQAES